MQGFVHRKEQDKQLFALPINGRFYADGLGCPSVGGSKCCLGRGVDGESFNFPNDWREYAAQGMRVAYS